MTKKEELEKSNICQLSIPKTSPLKNKKLEDRNFNTYYLIVNNENQDKAFFCFEKTVKEDWNDLVSN